MFDEKTDAACMAVAPQETGMKSQFDELDRAISLAHTTFDDVVGKSLPFLLLEEAETNSKEETKVAVAPNRCPFAEALLEQTARIDRLRRRMQDYYERLDV